MRSSQIWPRTCRNPLPTEAAGGQVRKLRAPSMSVGSYMWTAESVLKAPLSIIEAKSDVDACTLTLKFKCPVRWFTLAQGHKDNSLRARRRTLALHPYGWCGCTLTAGHLRHLHLWDRPVFLFFYRFGNWGTERLNNSSETAGYASHIVCRIIKLKNICW